MVEMKQEELVILMIIGLLLLSGQESKEVYSSCKDTAFQYTDYPGGSQSEYHCGTYQYDIGPAYCCPTVVEEWIDEYGCEVKKYSYGSAIDLVTWSYVEKLDCCPQGHSACWDGYALVGSRTNTYCRWADLSGRYYCPCRAGGCWYSPIYYATGGYVEKGGWSGEQPSPPSIDVYAIFNELFNSIWEFIKQLFGWYTISNRPVSYSGYYNYFDPEYAYDNNYGDTSTYAWVGGGLEGGGITYTFQVNPIINNTLCYTHREWQGGLRIWDYVDSGWDELPYNTEATPRKDNVSLGIGSEYISSSGEVTLIMEAIPSPAARAYLYDTYID